MISFSFENPLILVPVIGGAILFFLAVYHKFPIHLIYKSKIAIESMLDAVGDPLAVVSSDYTIVRVNRAYAKLIGLPYKKCLEKRCFTLFRSRTTPCDDCRLQDTLSKQRRHFLPHSKHPSRDGAVSIRFSPFPFDCREKSKQYIIEHIRDITTLEQLKVELEEKNAFLSKTTHKLKTATDSIREELKRARRIQQGLLPLHLPESKYLKLDLVYKPISEVGGDIYDFLPLGKQKLGVFIGDASGHGLSSALVGTISKMSLSNHTKTDLSTSEMLFKMNEDLCENIHTSHYLTCFWCIFDFQQKTLHYSRAGHPDPIVIRKNGDIIPLHCSGSFLGILNDTTFEQAVFTFSPGDRFYFFTDGIYDVLESPNSPRYIFSYDRFKSLIGETAEIPFENVIAFINNKLSNYSREDDHTLIVAEIAE